MKRILILLLALTSTSSFAFTNCDLTSYRWTCELPTHLKPTKSAHSLVYCGRTHSFITKAQYDQLARYHRANVNMSIAVNDEYADGQCLPAGR